MQYMKGLGEHGMLMQSGSVHMLLLLTFLKAPL